MKAEKIVKLRVQNSTFCRRIRVVQGDTGRTFRFILEDMTMDGSEQARIYAKKPDGTEVYNECEVVSTNEVTMETDSGQIFAVIGIVPAEIRIVKDSKIVTSYSFEFEVQQSLTRAAQITSTNEFEALEKAISEAQSLQAPQFTEAGTRVNINSGESLPTLFGKIKKWFTDLNKLITLVGNSDISAIGNGTITNAISTLNSNRLDAKILGISYSGEVTLPIKGYQGNLIYIAGVQSQNEMTFSRLYMLRYSNEYDNVTSTLVCKDNGTCSVTDDIEFSISEDLKIIMTVPKYLYAYKIVVL